MLYIITVSFIAVLLSYLAYQNKNNGLEWSFVLLTVFLAIRYDFGNDYMGYLYAFNSFKTYSIGLFEFDRFLELRGYGEPLWVFINMLFIKFGGFFLLVILMTIFENYTIYRFIKKNVKPEYYWLSVFIFVFNTSFMLVGASMLRQWFVLCLFLYCIDFIREKRPLPFLLLLIPATQIHSSAWILLPTYFMSYINYEKIKGSMGIVLLLFYFVWLYIGPTYYARNIDFLLQADEIGKYEVYLEDEKVSFSIIGYITRYLFPIICLFQISKVNDEKKYLFSIYALYMLVLPLVEVTQLVSRIGTYFSILSIFVIPETIDIIKKRKQAVAQLLLAFFVLLSLYNYFPFYKSSTFGEYYREYHTIFSEQWN